MAWHCQILISVFARLMVWTGPLVGPYVFGLPVSEQRRGLGWWQKGGQYGCHQGGERRHHILKLWKTEQKVVWAFLEGEDAVVHLPSKYFHFDSLSLFSLSCELCTHNTDYKLLQRAQTSLPGNWQQTKRWATSKVRHTWSKANLIIWLNRFATLISWATS